MNIGVIICLVLSIFFAILSIIFTFLKEKATIFISGFNSLSKDEREEYNRKKLSIDMRNSLFGWAVILLLGAVSSFYINTVQLWQLLFG